MYRGSGQNGFISSRAVRVRFDKNSCVFVCVSHWVKKAALRTFDKKKTDVPLYRNMLGAPRHKPAAVLAAVRSSPAVGKLPSSMAQTSRKRATVKSASKRRASPSQRLIFLRLRNSTDARCTTEVHFSRSFPPKTILRS